MMFKLIKNNIRMFINKITSMSFVDELKLSIMLSFSIAFLICLFFLFYRALKYIYEFQIIGNLLLIKVVEMAFIIIFVLVVISSFLSAFSTMYKSNELDLLFSLPLSQKTIFIYKTAEVFFQINWMIAIAFLPFLFAFAILKNMETTFLLFLLLGVVPLFLIGTLVGVTIGFLLMKFLPKQNLRDISTVLLSVLAGGGYIGFRLLEPEKLSDPFIFEEMMHYLAYLNMPVTKILPSYFSTNILISFLNKDLLRIITNSLMLCTIFFICLLIACFLLGSFYHTIWSKTVPAGKLHTKEYQFRTTSKFLSLAKKEIKCFFRDSKQWVQLTFVTVLSLIYIFTIIRLPLSIGKGLPFDVEYLKRVSSLINVIGVCLIISAICLRFVYPMISIEGKSYWILRSFPINAHEVLRGKFLLSTIPVCLISVSLISITNHFLGIEKDLFYILLALNLIATFTLCCMALCFGSIFPMFNYENFTQVQTSFGGFMYIICSIIYMALKAFITLPQLLRGPLNLSNYSGNIVSFLVLSIFLIALSYEISKRSIDSHQIY